MKNQTDLIISIVSGVIAVGLGIAMFATQRQPATPEAAPTVELGAVPLPKAETMVTYSNSLSGGGTAGGRGAMAGGSMGSMGSMGMRGMPSGMPGMPSGMPTGMAGRGPMGTSGGGMSPGPMSGK